MNPVRPYLLNTSLQRSRSNVCSKEWQSHSQRDPVCGRVCPSFLLWQRHVSLSGALHGGSWRLLETSRRGYRRCGQFWIAKGTRSQSLPQILFKPQALPRHWHQSFLSPRHYEVRLQGYFEVESRRKRVPGFCGKYLDGIAPCVDQSLFCISP